ncbi:hypothetical protein ACFX1W_030973 [Malus domestica]
MSEHPRPHRARKAGQAKAKTVARLDCEEDGVINEDDEELTVPQGLKRNKRVTNLDRKTLIDGQVAAQRDISKHVTYLIFGETGSRACKERKFEKKFRSQTRSELPKTEKMN